MNITELTDKAAAPPPLRTPVDKSEVYFSYFQTIQFYWPNVCGKI